MKKLILGCILASPFFGTTQNLIKNPEFKSSKKVTGWSQINKAEGWSNPNGATADLFEKGRCKTDVGIDQNFMGTQSADGNNYAGIIAYYDDQRVNLFNTVTSLEMHGEKAYGLYAEYLQGELTQELTEGKSYSFSFKVSLAEMSSRAVKGLGAYFSKEKLNNKTNSAINASPQIISEEMIKTSDGWVEIKGSFTAKGGERFVTIGAFNSQFTSEKTVAENQNDYKKAYYYVYGPNLVLSGGVESPTRPIANFEDIKAGKKVIFLTLSFESGKAKITTQSYEEINACAKFLTNNPEINVQIDGHTDAVGAADANQKLSEERAKAVKEYLISKGVAENRMKPVGFGESKPLETTGGEANPKNRRIELYKSN
jgi:OmpA-OmpF porin, OOP family